MFGKILKAVGAVTVVGAAMYTREIRKMSQNIMLKLANDEELTEEEIEFVNDRQKVVAKTNDLKAEYKAMKARKEARMSEAIRVAQEANRQEEVVRMQNEEIARQMNDEAIRASQEAVNMQQQTMNDINNINMMNGMM